MAIVTNPSSNTIKIICIVLVILMMTLACISGDITKGCSGILCKDNKNIVDISDHPIRTDLTELEISATHTAIDIWYRQSTQEAP